MIKNLDPTDDPGLFNLQIDGATEEGDAGHNGTTTALPFNAGTHSVGETAGTGTNLDDYEKSISCVNGEGAGQGSTEGDSGGPLNVTLDDDEAITCTITTPARPGRSR